MKLSEGLLERLSGESRSDGGRADHKPPEEDTPSAGENCESDLKLGKRHKSERRRRKRLESISIYRKTMEGNGEFRTDSLRRGSSSWLSWRSKRIMKSRIRLQAHTCEILFYFTIIMATITSYSHNFKAEASEENGGLFGGQNAAFHEQPQALFMSSYNLESGSGSGYEGSQSGNQIQPDVSSPSLITAKCWNNYENDDCKELNFITGAGEEPASGSRKQQAHDDDSLITPVIIFESSSPVGPDEEPGQQSAAEASTHFQAPPYFSSSHNRNELSSPGGESKSWPLHNQQEVGADSTLAPPSSSDGNQYGLRTSSSGERKDQPVTSRPKSIFVATPAPKKPPKTTTMGRKCLDENDSDCDEPDEHNAGKEEDSEEGAGEEDPEEESSKSAGGDKEEDERRNEIGSGEWPTDDSEEEDDADGEPGDQFEGSGGSEPGQPADKTLGSSTTSSGQHVEITTIASGGTSPLSSTTRRPPEAPPVEKRPDASIQVVVHPTLPPNFPTTAATEVEPEVPTTTTHSSTSTSTPANDIFKSEPIFPPSSQLEGGASGNEPQAPDEADSSSQQSTTEDLVTFKAIPLASTERPAGSRVALAPSETPGKVSGMHLLETGPQQPPKPLQNPWREKPTARPSPSPPAESWQRAPARSGPEQRPFDPVAIQNQKQVVRANSELLSKLFIYAGTIIVLIAIIMSVIVFMVLRQRRRLMSMKQAPLASQQLLLNGAAGPPGSGFGAPQQMVASMSHGNQLMGAMQQPSLLDTYAPGKGVLAGKMFAKEDEEQNELDEQEEEEEEEMNRSLEGANIRPADEQKLEGAKSAEKRAGGRQLRIVGQSSWSTEDQTTTSGSQKTSESQQQIMGAEQRELNGRHYADSLSDGRQNSSSISDSPENGLIMPAYQQQQQQQQPLPLAHQQHPQLGPQVNPIAFSNGLPPLVHMPAYERQPYLPAQIPKQSPAFNGYPIKPPAPLPPFAQQAAFFNQDPRISNERANFMGLAKPPAPLNTNGHNFHLPKQHFPHPDQPPQPNFDHFQRPINPARIAMNPLATMSRRYQQGVGLNRGIYSEDSSSFITASPSLARTSSSSSFAFTNKNGSQLNTPIRAKPFLDQATGRIIDDYPDAPTPNNPPLVFNRKPDFSEPWYV